MKLRRVIIDDRLELQALTADGSWGPAPDPSVLGGPVFASEWELANA